MALSGWPEKIRVIFGSLWDGTKGNGLGIGGTTELVLTKTQDGAGNDIWSEDGTRFPHKTNNRIRLAPQESNGNRYENLIRCPKYTKLSGSTFYAWIDPINAIVAGGTNSTYTFRNIWLGNYTGFNLSILLGGNEGNITSWAYSGTGTLITTSNLSYFNPKTFSTYEEYVAPSSLAPDKSTYRYG